MGKLYHLIGMSVVKNKESKTMWIGQLAYTKNVLKEVGVQDRTPANTTVDVGSKLETEQQTKTNVQIYSSINQPSEVCISQSVPHRT